MVKSLFKLIKVVLIKYLTGHVQIPSLVDDFVLVDLLVALESIDNDNDVVVDTVVVAVVTFAAVSCGNQVSFSVAQINIVLGCTSGNVSSSISVPSASVFIVIVFSSPIPSFL